MNNTLRILYIGGQYAGSTGRERRLALEQLGHTVETFDTDAYTRNRGRLELMVTRRLCFGPPIWQLNRDLLRFARGKSFDFVWVSKGIWVYGDTITELKRAGAKHIAHYNTDDPFGSLGTRTWRIFIQAIPSYDTHFVRRQENISEYERLNARQIIRAFPNYSARLHRPLSIDSVTRQRLGGAVGFIGDYEYERASTMHYLASNGIPVKIWGPNWRENCPFKHPNLVITGQSLYGEQYVEAINSFDINLCFLRKCNRDLSTSRSVEIPACGAFMIAERTTEHSLMFTEGVEAEFFNDPEELRTKIQHYLEQPELRTAIGLRALYRCKSSNYDVADFMQAALESCGSGQKREY